MARYLKISSIAKSVMFYSVTVDKGVKKMFVHYQLLVMLQACCGGLTAINTRFTSYKTKTPASGTRNIK